MSTKIWFEDGKTEYGEKTIIGYAENIKIACLTENRSGWYKGQIDATVRGERYRWEREPRFEHLGNYPTVAAARFAVEQWYEKNAERVRAEASKYKPAPVRLLPKADSEFYPTPSKVAGEMIASVNWRGVKTILEPSAGKADLAEAVCSMFASFKRTRIRNYDPVDQGRFRDMVDCVEIDNNLQAVLKDKGYHVVGDDFLTFATYKRYDVIIMNPPFSNGDEHLLKALQMQQNGGQVCCLLNADTIRNPYTNRRKVLMQKLRDLNAKIKFVQHGFRDAERKTDVDVAIVTVKIPVKTRDSAIFEHLKRAQAEQVKNNTAPEALVSGDWMQQMISTYNMEAQAGIDLLQEYFAMEPYVSALANGQEGLLISIEVDGRDQSDLQEAVNTYVQKVRTKYWRLLFLRKELTSLMTSDIADEYSRKVNDLVDYDFSEFNIRTIMRELSAQLVSGVELSIMKLFDELSAEHAWYPECEKNIHYYSGWKTNQAHKVGMKVIIPANGCYAEAWKQEKLDSYRVFHIISDLEQALSYLDTGDACMHISPESAIRMANMRDSNVVDFSYFQAKFYKKGTCHLKFHPAAEKLIDRLNIFAAQNRNWLPPSYGKKHYADMIAEERDVVDSFPGDGTHGSGENAYENVLQHKSDYLINVGNAANLPLLE